MLEKYLRIAHKYTPLDTITFSTEGLSNVEFLMESLWYVTKRQFLTFKMQDKIKENSFEQLPPWF